MSTDALAPSARTALRIPRVDKLGVIILVLAIVGFILPFVIVKPNRIVAGAPMPIAAALSGAWPALLYVVIALGCAVALFRFVSIVRLAGAALVLTAMALFIGAAATYLTPAGNTYARISPGGGFWLLLFCFTLLAADALVRLKLGPWLRVLVLLVAVGAVGLLLWSGAWNSLSIVREYFSRADSFWREDGQHISLAFGSLLAATLVGIPLGILGYRQRRIRAVMLNLLNIVQTLPSIALFGLLIAPLAWVAANIPGAAAIGISGIGAAPAMVALFGYSLLPIVANTVIGLDGVPFAVKDAARGMGMTDREIFATVELPLAFPVILTGIRIVLVQNIGLATIAALIGGGGFGVFVFQGIGQTALDLVLLGAVPTVALAFGAAIVLDAVIELVSTRRTRSP